MIDGIAYAIGYFLDNWKFFVAMIIIVIIVILCLVGVQQSVECNPEKMHNMCDKFCFNQANTISESLGVTFDCAECVCVDGSIGVLK